MRWPTLRSFWSSKNTLPFVMIMVFYFASWSIFASLVCSLCPSCQQLISLNSLHTFGIEPPLPTPLFILSPLRPFPIIYYLPFFSSVVLPLSNIEKVVVCVCVCVFLMFKSLYKKIHISIWYFCVYFLPGILKSLYTHV